jgi:hypothetical protein
MRNFVEREQLPEGITVLVEYDPDPESPRAWGNFGRVTLVDRCRYNFGDDTATAEQLQAIAKNPDLVTLPIFIYDHSGITINTTGFSCRWDSGMIGIIWVDKARARVELGVKRLNLDRVRQMLRVEVETLDQYVTGTIYGYRVQDSEGEELSACWGFYGTSTECLAEGLAEARAIVAAPDYAALPA